MQAQHEARLAERQEFFGQSMSSSDAMERLMRYERSLTIAEMKDMREALRLQSRLLQSDSSFRIIDHRSVQYSTRNKSRLSKRAFNIRRVISRLCRSRRF